MTFLDQLRLLRTAPQSVWLQFIGVYRAACRDLYLFFEGNDDLSYYQPYLRNKWLDRGVLHVFRCDGKSGVVSLMPRIKSTLDFEWRGLFFIDKDVDDFCGVVSPSDAYLYETDAYAIENYVVSTTALDVLWTDLLRLPASDQRINEIRQAFGQTYSTFANAMSQVMAWVIFLRRAGHRVVLNSVSMDKLVHLDSECACSLVPGWAEHIMAASGISGLAHDATQYAAIVAELKRHDPKAYVRGKFDLWFFVKFIGKIVATVSERITGQPNTVCRVQISLATAIDIFAPRLQPPPKLTAFLNSVLPN